MSWQDNFKQATTGIMFVLTLKENQISLLLHIEKYPYRWGDLDRPRWYSVRGIDTFIPTFRSLERRGLAEHNPVMRTKGKKKLKTWVYRLTPAGKKVSAMLKLAGFTSEQFEKTHMEQRLRRAE